jgi:hypothetical protein
MRRPRQISPTCQVASGTSNSYGERAQKTTSASGDKADTPRFLVTLDRGIGDTVMVALSAIDQIIKDDPDAHGKIDVLCNPIQAQLFECDPRINRVFQTDRAFNSGPNIKEWFRGSILDVEAVRFMRLLRDRHYEAVLPSMVAPGLYFRIHSPLMYPDLLQVAKNILKIRAPAEIPVRLLIRQMVNRYFRKDIASSALTDTVLLYMGAKHVQKAALAVERVEKISSVSAENVRVLLVAADSASVVTRPPTRLLAPALAEVLSGYHQLIVCILPSYTDTRAAENLWHALLADFPGRIFMRPEEPMSTLLETAALIDQADIFVTGDTGVMHLAAATKMLGRGESAAFAPRNTVKIIAIFGGTNPDIYGYKERTMIIGKGRKEQRTLCPGYMKDLFKPRGKDLFDHISPQQLAEAISSQVSL